MPAQKLLWALHQLERENEKPTWEQWQSELKQDIRRYLEDGKRDKQGTGRKN